ncbi:MAG: multifunctional 2',3'-cyclic-nucleotide 2'-phosphodiesterase/5'-nucleotidase/3'-nucleotidase [Chloroflexi bacterium]|nr:multifunctional 2',3'-cyclic-nucleotide 2'-phosphodiesterase/5'-nucleotidase/3'-nucleotidase [Chloroflexota bacterium]
MLLMVAPTALAQGPFTLTILHTNDTHAHLESFGDPLQGGIARRFTAIQQIKGEADNVLLVDAGDAFQGTLFFNQWQGEEEAYFMNALGYQAMTVGNHEFDSGPATLAEFIKAADFPVVSANLDVSQEAALKDLIKPYTIVTIGGEKIGVLGLSTPETVYISSPGPNVKITDPIAAAKAAVKELEGQGVNKIVCLSHLGYPGDMSLAKAVDGIDVIVGGHTHTLLGSMEDASGVYPTIAKSPAGTTVLIVSAQDWGKYLGRLDVTFTAEGAVKSYQGAPIAIDESIAEDATVAADVARFAEAINELKATVIGKTTANLEGTRELARTQEVNLGNLIADAILWKTASEKTQICIINGGGIRASIPAGDVTMGQVLEVLPFGNQIATFGLKGADVVAALEQGVSQVEEQKGQFPQVGGLRFSFDPNKPAGSRVIKVEVKNADGSYSPIKLDAVYQVASNDFMRQGGDGYTMFAENAIDPYDAGAVLADAVAEYIAAHSPINPAIEGRITTGTAPAAQPKPAPTPQEPVAVPMAGTLVGNNGGAFAVYELMVESATDVSLRLQFAPDDPIIARGFGVNIYGPLGQVAVGRYTGQHGERTATFTAQPDVKYLIQVYNYIPNREVGYAINR